jgi:hypothetical protein
VRASALLLALALDPALASRPAAACRLALVLAMDVSRSVSPTDFRISRDGLVAALRDPEVRRAFLAGGPVALSVFDWDEPGLQRIVVPWRTIAGAADLDAAAAEAAGWQRPPRVGLTATGDALLFARDWLAAAPVCDAQVIDLATDGHSNAGPPVQQVYLRHDFGAIGVNALAIGEHETGLVPYLAGEVIRGPGAFVELAPRHTDVPRAMRRKLIRELSVPLFGGADGAPGRRIE